MTKDVVALVGILLILIGIYFIYWPLCFIVSGLILTSYCLWIAYVEARNEENADN